MTCPFLNVSTTVPIVSKRVLTPLSLSGRQLSNSFMSNPNITDSPQCAENRVFPEATVCPEPWRRSYLCIGMQPSWGRGLDEG